MDQLDLFEPVAKVYRGEIACTRPIRAMHRATDPDTSRLAAVQALRSSRNNRWLALNALCDAGANGLTDHQLAEITGTAQTSIGVRRGELRDLGLVERLVTEDGKARRLNANGAWCAVWVVTAAGCEALATGAPL